MCIPEREDCVFYLTHQNWKCMSVLSTVATDALMKKHQAISIHSAHLIFIVLDQFHIGY